MTHLKIGDNAPEINAKNQNGKPISLNDFPNKKIILYFYPKDNTPGCTAESCNLRDFDKELSEKGFATIGVSADNETQHQKFIEKYNLPFPLIADIEKKVIQDYGVWGPKKFMGKEYDGIHRTTFVISEDRKIEKIFDKVKTKEHAEQILADY